MSESLIHRGGRRTLKNIRVDNHECQHNDHFKARDAHASNIHILVF
jgi:hypothetical protein